jgi:hypothetical protein
MTMTKKDKRSQSARETRLKRLRAVIKERIRRLRQSDSCQHTLH